MTPWTELTPEQQERERRDALIGLADVLLRVYRRCYEVGPPDLYNATHHLQGGVPCHQDGQAPESSTRTG
jgi:hypothetical protein